jgi:tetraacyldisaccharide 4'-kinase
VVLDYTRPVFEDDFLPVGNLRDNLNSLYRAHYFIVTKCPEDMQPLDQRMWRKDLQLVAYQKIYFTRVVPTAAVPLFQTPNHLREGDEVIVMSGIGNPKPFIKSVRKHYNVVANLVYPDHHVYTVEDIEKIVSHIKQHPNAMLLTTEKDAVKLRRSRRVPDLMRERLFYQPVKVEFLEGSDENFFETLKSDLLGKVHLGDLTIGGNKEN